MRELLGDRASVLGAVLVAAMILIGSDTAVGQEKKKLSWTTKPENTKVTVQQALDIPDLTGHIIRITEIRRTWPDNPPTVAGLKVVEEVASGFADIIAGNGKQWGYSSWRFENGDRNFSEWQLVIQTVTNPDQGKKTTFIGTYVTTGGTGTLKGIRGLGRFAGVAELNAEGKVITSQLSGEGEYWFEK